MLKLFDKNSNYTLPNGRITTGDQMSKEPEYSILSQKDCVVDVSDGVLKSYQTLSDLANQYDIEYDTEDDQDPNEILNSVLAAISEKNNTEAQKNEFFKYSTTLKAVAQITAMSFTDEQALEVKDIYPGYQVDHAYKQGEFFTHEGELYKVNQDHTSASQWEPGSVGTESLYTHLTLNEDGYPIWQQPTGAHDAYNTGDIVEYNGKLYQSTIDGNTYSPDSYPAGWVEYTEPTE